MYYGGKKKGRKVGKVRAPYFIIKMQYNKKRIGDFEKLFLLQVADKAVEGIIEPYSGISVVVHFQQRCGAWR